VIEKSTDFRCWPEAAEGRWAEHVRSALGDSDINLFGNRERVVNLDAEIADRAFDLGVA
jgi:hypothetical protein